MKDKQKSQLITSGLGGADGAGDHGAGEEGDRGGGRSPGGFQVLCDDPFQATVNLLEGASWDTFWR